MSRLQPGQRFRCKAFDRLIGTIVWDPEKGPYVDYTRLALDHGWHLDAPDYEPVHQACWTQTREGGWSRTIYVPLKVRAPRLEDQVFVVQSAGLSGGGTGHGPHDVFPDGWTVLAYQANQPAVSVRFRQSGCFCDVIPDELIEVLASPAIPSQG